MALLICSLDISTGDMFATEATEDVIAAEATCNAEFTEVSVQILRILSDVLGL